MGLNTATAVTDVHLGAEFSFFFFPGQMTNPVLPALPFRPSPSRASPSMQSP